VKDDSLVLTDDDFLSICDQERVAAVNYETDEELSNQRERALEYTKGEMKDVPAMPRRSKAVSTDVADFIEAELPDLMDILVGGEDPVTFKPNGPEDVDQAELETKYVRHVIFDENDGWFSIYSAVKDCAEVKTGIIKHWWEETDNVEEEVFSNQTAVDMQLLEESGYEITEQEDAGHDPEFGPLYNLIAKRTVTKGRVRLMACDPADFSVSADTTLADFENGTYKLLRIRDRAQEFIRLGFDPDLVEQLPAYSDFDDEEERARDTVDESDDGRHSDSHETLRTVEVHLHVLRVDADGDGVPECWHIYTDSSASILLHKEQKNRSGFAVGCLYPRTHRFYALSEADKLMEVQKINTVLLRSQLDNYYFDLNKRFEVNMASANENTIADLLRNEPGVPIRSRDGNAVKPINDRGGGIDTFQGMEYITTMGEMRTGIARNVTGLNAETLHDTASGAIALMDNSAKRQRMKARIIAGTLLRSLYLGVQADLAENMSEPDRVRFHGDKEFTTIDPSMFGRRKDMTVTIAIGSGGKQQMLQTVANLLEQQERVAQSPYAGEITSSAHVYRALKLFAETAGLPDPSRYWQDPEEAQQQGGQQGPSPEEQAMAAEMQAKQAELQMKGQEAQAKIQLEQFKAQTKAELERQIAQERIKLEREKAEFEADMAERKAQAEYELAMIKAQDTQLNGYRQGGRLDQ